MNKEHEANASVAQPSTANTRLGFSDAGDARSLLRKEILELRAELPAPYRAHKSAALCEELLLSLDLTLAMTGTAAEEATVAVYAAFPEEVNLHDFILGAYQRGVRIAFPCLVTDAHTCTTFNATPASQTMEMRAVCESDYTANNVIFLQKQLKKFEHDSTELGLYPYVSADELTMLIVPVVGFDSAGNRLGYGGGNYDRYLSQFNSTPADSFNPNSQDTNQSTPNIDQSIPEATQSSSSKFSADSSTSNAPNTNLDTPNTPNTPKANLSTSNASGKSYKKSMCRIVGVAFEEQGVASIPTEAHDIPLKILAL